MEPLIETASPSSLDLDVTKLDKVSYRAIFADTRRLLTACWPEIIITALLAPPLLWQFDRFIVHALFSNADYSNPSEFFLRLLAKCCLDSLWFLALTPALMLIKSRIEGKSRNPLDALKGSLRHFPSLLLAAVVYNIVYNSGIYAPVLIPGASEYLFLLSSEASSYLKISSAEGAANFDLWFCLFVPMTIGFVLTSFLFFFNFVAVFEAANALRSLRHSIKLVWGHWWKLSLLLVLIEPNFLLTIVIDRFFPDISSGIVGATLVNSPIRILAIGLSAVVFLNLLSVQRHKAVCSECGAQVSVNEDELNAGSFLCPRCNRASTTRSGLQQSVGPNREFD